MQTSGRAITNSFYSKLLEEIDRVRSLVHRIPADMLSWSPDAVRVQGRPPLLTEELLCHLLECVAGFCAVLHRCFPEELASFQELRSIKVRGTCSPADVLGAFNRYSPALVQGFALLEDSHLSRLLPTVFVPSGETVMTLLLGNFEHLVNHKFQLFFYLKLFGVPVGSRDLYVFREPPTNTTRD